MTADGKIPFTQIAIGILIGAIAMYVYVKMYKGDLPFMKKTSLTADLQPVDTIEPLAAPPLPASPPPQILRRDLGMPPTMKRRMPQQVKLAATMIPIPIQHDEYEDYDDDEGRIVEQNDDMEPVDDNAE